MKTPTTGKDSSNQSNSTSSSEDSTRKIQMNRVVTLRATTTHIEELQGTIINYHEELRAMEEVVDSLKFYTQPKFTSNRANMKAEMTQIEMFYKTLGWKLK